ncbi:MAG: sugar phosphate isomerase/epimerase family protein [Bacillota bacterium]|mgnify:CR=1 FL=1|jgi:sugar phosphate isomerase/epimerase|nr:sugar phosphate isomerase/epimerase family protein [Bacillota bacterium]
MEFLCCWLYAIDRYGFPPSIPDTLSALREIKQMGFSYAELEGVSGPNLVSVYEHRHEIKDLVTEIGLHVANFVPVIPELRELEEEKWRYGREMFQKGVEVAKTIGAEFIQIDSFPPCLECLDGVQYDSENVTNYGALWRYRLSPEFSWDRQWEVFVSNAKWCAQRAQDAGLKLIVEPRVGEIVSNTDAMLRLIEAVDEPNLGAIIDTAHQYAQKEILPLSIAKLGDRLFYLHLSDNDGSRNDHFVPGDGTIDWVGFFEALKIIGYQGYAGLDIAKTKEELSVSYLKARDIYAQYASEAGL